MSLFGLFLPKIFRKGKITLIPGGYVQTENKKVGRQDMLNKERL
jgi:hypothetical protein